MYFSRFTPFCTGTTVTSDSSGIDKMSQDGPDPRHPNIARQKHYQEKAFDYINQALNIDEKDLDILQKKEAIDLYKQGIKELEKGVGLYIPVNTGDQVLVRAHRLKEKMMVNLATTRERVDYLTMNLHLNTLSLQSEKSRPSSKVPTRPSVPSSTRPTSLTSDMSRPSSFSSRIPPPTTSISPSVTVPKNNRAAELRVKSTTTNNNRAGRGRQGVKKVSEPSKTARDGLKSACQAIKGVDSKLVETILNEVVPRGMCGVKFGDISGQDKAKEALHEMVVLPSLRPELFTGLRTPARGLLLFGPPGNGKTLLARALAGESCCNLINISSSSLTSKWLGEGEKLVKALFAVAREIQPTIVFIDEIDALLSERRSGEHEAVRRIKTEFLLQFEGMMTGQQERTIVVAATNRPQELDEAALRRFTKRVYVRMPDNNTRRELVKSLLAREGNSHNISDSDIAKIVDKTEGYTCSDITNLARDAALAPIREISTAELATIGAADMRKITVKDFTASAERVRKSLTKEGLADFEKWNQAFGDIS